VSGQTDPPCINLHQICTLPGLFNLSGVFHLITLQVYFIAGVGVVYSRPPANTQTFFLGHTDDILSLAMCPAPVKFDGQTYPACTLVATGQVRGIVANMWDASCVHAVAHACENRCILYCIVAGM